VGCTSSENMVQQQQQQQHLTETKFQKSMPQTAGKFNF
jgi:hypothetical protein